MVGRTFSPTYFGSVTTVLFSPIYITVGEEESRADLLQGIRMRNLLDLYSVQPALDVLEFFHKIVFKLFLRFHSHTFQFFPVVKISMDHSRLDKEHPLMANMLS